MDVVGVVQHHDAVTGTGKQHVADDYARQIFKGLENTNPVYAQAINFWADKVGFVANDWQWCLRYNSTYADCPIADYADGDSFKMLIAVHNPANLATKISQIAVPHGNLLVKRFDVETGGMLEAEANVLCNIQEEESDPSSNVDNCQLFIKHEVPAGGIGFFTVEYSSANDLSIRVQTDADLTIETDELSLTYLPDYAGEGIYF